MVLRHRVRIAAAVGIVLACALSTSSCAGDDSSDSEGAKDTLSLASTIVPTSFAIGYFGGGEQILYTSIFDTVITQEPDGSFTPGLAEEWSYNDDLTQLTLQIRTDASFSNGEAVDAEAVRASLEATRTGPATSGIWGAVESIEAPNDTTVVITLSEPDAGILPGLSVINGIVAEPSMLGTKAEATAPIGSGPYILDLGETQVGSTYVLDKNEQHWDADRYPFERLEYSLIADTATVVNGLQVGQLDHASRVQPEQLKQLEGQFTTGVDKASVYGAIWFADRAGEVLAPLGDIRVRQAINMVIDRQGITENLNPGVRHGAGQIMNPVGDAYLPELEEQYPYDVAEAQNLMAEAGYADGFSVSMPSSASSVDFEAILTQSLAEIGITVIWEPVALQDIAARISSGDFPIFYHPAAWESSDAVDISNILGPVYNPFGSMTPELQQLLDQANASDDPEAFAAVNRYFVDEAWTAPVTKSTFHWGHGRGLTYEPPTMWGLSIRPWGVVE